MRLNTITEYPMTAELWTSGPDQATLDENQRTYTYNRSIACRIVAGNFRSTSLLTMEVLPLFGRILNVKDRGGSLILPGLQFRINQIQPMMNLFGYLDGYRYTIGQSGQTL